MPDPDKARIRHYISVDPAIRRCQKCGALLTANWERTGVHGLTPDDEGDGYWGKDCPYLECDAPDCRAKRHPETMEELRAAVEHWRHHHLNAGCSHGN